MAVAQYAAERLFSRYTIRTVEVDDAGASTDPIIVDLGQPQGASLKLLPIADIQSFAAIVMKSVGTGNTDEFSIIVADDAAGTTNVAAVKTMTTATAQTQNAVGDQLVLEVSAEQLRESSATAAYVGVRVELATGTDELIVTAIAEKKRQYAGLTANYIS